MNAIIDLAIDVSGEESQVYHAMAARRCGVRIVDDVSACVAVITDQPAGALKYSADDLYVLLVQPFQLPESTYAQLASSQRAIPAFAARFQPSMSAVKQALQEGKLGEPGLLRIHRWQARTALALLAIELDLALWMFGSFPKEIYGVQRTGYIQAHLGFAGGGMALIDIDESIPGADEYYSLSLIGSTGAAYADDHANRHLLLGPQGATSLRSYEGDLALSLMIGHFVGSIREGGGFSDGWRDAATASSVARQVRVAADDGCVLVGGGHG